MNTEFPPGEVSPCNQLDLKDPAGIEWFRGYMRAATYLHFTCKLQKLNKTKPGSNHAALTQFNVCSLQII